MPNDIAAQDKPRARRRHYRWRMVRRAVALFRRYDAPKGNVLDARQLSVTRRPHDPERLADNLRNCSCAYCSAHRRTTSGPTMRERRFGQDDQ